MAIARSKAIELMHATIGRKKVIDQMYAILGRIGATSCRDGFIDGTLKMVLLFGFAATYVVAPDGSTHTAVHAAPNLSQARICAWAFHEATLLRWLETADTASLAIELARESSQPGHNALLVSSIRKELDRRSSYQLKAVA